MDNFKVIYKILRTLEKNMGNEQFSISSISAEKMGVSSQKWKQLMIMMQDEGLINEFVAQSKIDDSDNLLTVGELIRKVRKEKGLTQAALGRKCVPPLQDSAIRKYELGLQMPKIQTLSIIANALKVSSSKFIDAALHEHNNSNNHNRCTETSEIGTAIRTTRKLKGITQKELSEIIGTSQQNLAQYESGKRNPKTETLVRIANALEVPASMFLETKYQESLNMENNYHVIQESNCPKITLKGLEYLAGNSFMSKAKELLKMDGEII